MSRPVGTTVRFCIRGHDIAEVGRGANGRCRRCENEWQARHRAAERIRKAGQGRVPSAPLRRCGDRRHLVRAWAGYRGCSEASATRAVDRLFAERSITIDTADMWSIALGLHLALVYPALYASVSA